MRRIRGSLSSRTFAERTINPLDVGAVVVANHGPFSWGATSRKAVENAAVMEYAAEMAYIATRLNSDASMPEELLRKHFLRKHGKNAYYGQPGGEEKVMLSR